MNNSQFRIGNVFKKNNSLYVITAVDSQNETCTMLPFTSNILVGAPFSQKTEKHFCNCEPEWSEGCNVCDGNMLFTTVSPVSMKDYIFVANTIRDYLIQRFID